MDGHNKREFGPTAVHANPWRFVRTLRDQRDLSCGPPLLREPLGYQPVRELFDAGGESSVKGRRRGRSIPIWPAVAKTYPGTDISLRDTHTNPTWEQCISSPHDR